MDVDAVVLDIDGVLIDASNSYHRAIIETVRTVYGETIDRETIQLFKDAGGFNVDWRVTDAVSLFILARRRGYDTDLRSFTDKIAERGGGLSTARTILREELPETIGDEIEADWDQDLLKRTFQWLYLGPSRYAKYEDSDPPPDAPTDAGFIEEERILIDDQTLGWLHKQDALGVLTGRPAAEAHIAIERVGLDVDRKHLMSMDDWENSKPNPSGLITLAQRLEATVLAYAGDELDDVKTAVNAASIDSDRTYFGIGVQTGGVTGASGQQRFRSIGADAVIDSINELPATVSQLSGERPVQRED